MRITQSISLSNIHLSCIRKKARPEAVETYRNSLERLGGLFPDRRRPLWNSRINGGDQETVNESGGAERDRTADLMLAKHALSQLSYSPMIV